MELGTSIEARIMIARTALALFFVGTMVEANNNPICTNTEYMEGAQKKGCMELDISDAKSCSGKYNIRQHWKSDGTSWSYLQRGCSRITRDRWTNRYYPIFDSRLASTKHDVKKIEHLTYHHQAGGSGGDGSAESIYKSVHATHTSDKCPANGQCDKTWGDVAYHYMVDRFGNIIEAREIGYAPNSGTSGDGSAGEPGNYHYPGHFAVMFAGNFQKPLQTPSRAAIVSAARVLSAAQLKFKLGANAIKPHKHHSSNTTCPGDNFGPKQHIQLVKMSTSMTIQTILKNRGCKPGDVDGVLGNRSQNALARLELTVGELPKYTDPAKLLNALYNETQRCD